VLSGEPQMHRELGEGGGQAGHRGWIGPLVAGGERYSAVGGLLDRGLAGGQLDVVEDLPVRGLDLGLGVDWDLGEHVADAVDQTALPQGGWEGVLGGADQARRASLMISTGDRSPRLVRSARKSTQGSWPSLAAGASPRNIGPPVVVMP
jgi:hypothetical protein